ncbi:MAG: isoprenyl transferase [Clostridia bacterium]|nr:isoprenyl transferase [Clostridia bacterium]
MDFDKEKMPNHIGIIMDGNRRWATEQGKKAGFGHKAGAKTLENIVRYANNIGLKFITVYAFSTENWKRAEEEINGLMILFKTYLDDYAKRADTENIKVNILGDITAFNEDLQKSMKKCMERTKDNTGVVFSIALNYGGRKELVRAIKNIALEAKEGKIDIDNINENVISDHLYTIGIPDPDLIIRTSNELRLSGFLMWQSVYSELYFIDVNWPDFNEEQLDKAILEYQRRNRRFGGN